MTVVPFPATRYAERVQHCVDASLMLDSKIFVDRCITYTEIIETELRAAGIAEDDIRREVDAFLDKVNQEVSRSRIG